MTTIEASRIATAHTAAQDERREEDMPARHDHRVAVRRAGHGAGAGGRVVGNRMIAALYVERGGVYWDLPGVDAWDRERDARLYAGPWPVIAHPPCQRWGRFWHGSTRKPHQYKLGDDDGCFEAALDAVRRWGGVIEHPAHSRAWEHFGLLAPVSYDRWSIADWLGGWTCRVEQGQYGHFANKPTWLYAFGVSLPELRWGRGEQRLHPVALAKHGYEKARRIGMMAMVGGKDKTRIRNATPIKFRDLLISIAQSRSPEALTPPSPTEPGAAVVSAPSTRRPTIDGIPREAGLVRLARPPALTEDGTTVGPQVAGRHGLSSSELPAAEHP